MPSTIVGLQWGGERKGKIVGLLADLVVRAQIRGKKVLTPPALLEDSQAAKPLYETVPGWKTPTHQCKKIEDLPTLARRCIERLEKLCSIPIHTVSVGPQREAAIIREL